MEISTRIPQAMVLVFLLVLVMIMPVGYAVDWSIDMRLTWNSAPDEMPSLMRAGDGTIWVFWQSRRTGNYDVFYKVYSASGIHQWSVENQLTFDSNWDYLPSAMQAADGKIWVAWASNRSNGGALYDIFYKVNDGSAWSMDRQLTFDAANDRFPSITQTNDGKIWVFWTSRRNGNEDIFYKTTTDDGATWSDDTFFQKSHATDHDWDPAAMRSADGKLWLFWVRSPSEYIYYSVFDGFSWSSPTSVASGGGLEHWHPATTQTNDGKIWLVWDRGSDSVPTDIYYKTTSDNGATWSSETQFTTHINDDSGPSIAQDSQGNILIAWASNRGDGIIKPTDLFYRAYSQSSADHDVELFSVVPSAVVVLLGETVSVEVVARNRGTSSETNVMVRCYLNSTLLGSDILNMAPGELYALYFNWDTSGSVYANYTLSANVTSVPGELSVNDNNYLDGMVEITKGAVAAFSVRPISPQPNELITFNATYSQPSGGSIVSYEWDFGDGNITALGDPIVYHVYPFSGPYGVNLTVTDSRGLKDSEWRTVLVAIHDVAVVGGSIYDKAPWSVGVYCYVDIANEGDVMESVAVLVYFGNTFVGYEYIEVPPGIVPYVPIWCDTSEVSPGSYVVRAEALAVVGERDLSDNVMNLGSLWLYVLDLSVVSVVPSTPRTYIGHTVNVSVEIRNEGTVNANAQLRLYYNSTLIEQRGIFLLAEELDTFEFLWNTSGLPPGMYDLKAVVTATEVGFVELDTLDNVSIYNGVQVKIVGDVNGDGVVNADDLVEFAGSFGSTPGSSSWILDSDIEKDNIINVYDLRLIGRNYGNTNP